MEDGEGKVPLVKMVVSGADEVMGKGAGGKNFRFLGVGARLDECC